MAAKTNTSKVIKGQAFVSGNALVQDQMLMVVLPNGSTTTSSNFVTLIKDVWADLKSTTSEIKQVKGDCWCWEVKVTDTEDNSKEVTMKVQAPTPDKMVFWDEEKKNFDLEPNSDDSNWSKYWKEKIKNYLNSPSYGINAISPVEVTFPKTSYINQHGELVEKEEITFRRDDLGDMDNLLMMTF